MGALPSAVADRLPDTASGVEGRLEGAEGQYLASLTLASRFSLGVAFAGDDVPPSGTVFDRLLVMLPQGEMELSRCRFDAERLPRAHGRLVFLDDVFDCHSLIGDGRRVDLTSSLQKLSLFLSQSEAVRPEFKQFVADCRYGLSTFEKLLGEQERTYLYEPPSVREAAQEALLKAVEPDFNRFFGEQIARLDSLVDGLGRDEYERHGTYLRRVMWDFIMCSAFLQRTNLRPRGYAGDAEIMRMLYENRYVGEFVFNKLMHKHPVDAPAAQAVRYRRTLIVERLREVERRFASPSQRLRFLSVACGPAWELRDLYVSPEDVWRWSGALLDQDSEALAMAGEAVAGLEAQLGNPLRIDYVNDSVRTMLRTANLAERLGRFHFVYSMGLFDYLTPPVAKAVLGKLYDLLVPGGSIVVGNYHIQNPTRHYMAYWCDWVLYNRSEEEMFELGADLAGARMALTFDENRCQMFLQVDRMS